MIRYSLWKYVNFKGFFFFFCVCARALALKLFTKIWIYGLGLNNFWVKCLIKLACMLRTKRMPNPTLELCFSFILLARSEFEGLFFKKIPYIIKNKKLKWRNAECILWHMIFGLYFFYLFIFCTKKEKKRGKYRMILEIKKFIRNWYLGMLSTPNASVWGCVYHACWKLPPLWIFSRNWKYFPLASKLLVFFFFYTSSLLLSWKVWEAHFCCLQFL